MRISDWSSDVCSSDLPAGQVAQEFDAVHARHAEIAEHHVDSGRVDRGEGALAVMGLQQDGDSQLLQIALQEADDEPVVIDDENLQVAQGGAHSTPDFRVASIGSFSNRCCLGTTASPLLSKSLQGPSGAGSL